MRGLCNILDLRCHSQFPLCVSRDTVCIEVLLVYKSKSSRMCGATLGCEYDIIKMCLLDSVQRHVLHIYTLVIKCMCGGEPGFHHIYDGPLHFLHSLTVYT